MDSWLCPGDKDDRVLIPPLVSVHEMKVKPAASAAEWLKKKYDQTKNCEENIFFIVR
jgi:hypothetical protein